MKKNEYQYNKKRIIVLCNDVILMIVIGIAFIWSLFVLPIEADLGWSRSQTSFAYSIYCALVIVGAVIAALSAKYLSRPKIVAISGCLFLIGVLGTSRMDSIWELYLFFGLITGTACGGCYNSIMTTIVRWFPEKRGMVSGLLLMFYGLGGMILNPLADMLINSLGWRTAFMIVGSLAPFLMLISAYRIRPYRTTDGEIPEKIIKKVKEQTGKIFSTTEVPPRQMIKKCNFWLLYLWKTCLVSIGIGLSGHSVMMASEATIDTSSFALCAGIVALCNGCGRFAYGILYDLIGRRKTIFIITFCSLIGSTNLYITLNSHYTFFLYVSFIMIGTSFGGATVIGYNFIQEYYGRQYYGINTSLLNTVGVFAAFLGSSFSAMLHGMGGYSMVSFFFIGLSVIALASYILIEKNILSDQRIRND